jgi:O-antigen ligase
MTRRTVGGATYDAVALLTAFLLLVILIPSRLIFAPLGAAGTPATLVGVLLFIWYLVTWLNPGARLAQGKQPVRAAALMFFCTILVTYLSASRHAMPTSELNGLDRGPILIAGWLGVLVVAADGIESIDRLKTLLRRMVTGATWLGVFGIIQAITTFDISRYIVVPGMTLSATYQEQLVRGQLVRPVVTTINALEFAGVVSMCLPLAIYQARNEERMRGLRWLQVAIIGVSAVMTTSRTGILALIAIGIVLLPTWTARERLRAYGALLVSVLGLFLVVHGLLGTIKNLFLGVVSSDSSTASRTDAWSSAAPFIEQHPWFGRGFGTFDPSIYFFTDDQYLSSLIETGIVGALILIVLLTTGWFTARSARRASANENIRDLAQCMAASVAVAAVSFGTFDVLSFPMMTGMTFMLLGCIGAMWRLAPSTAAESMIQPTVDLAVAQSSAV